MCGLFGVVGDGSIDTQQLNSLAQSAQRRGQDASGLVVAIGNGYAVFRTSGPATKLLRRVGHHPSGVALGHSRLVTNGLYDNQPIERDGILVLHNGIIVNTEEIWQQLHQEPQKRVDTEVIPALVRAWINEHNSLDGAGDFVLEKCEGTVAALVLVPELGKMIAFSNNGSLYAGRFGDREFFASERVSLLEIGCSEIEQVFGERCLDVPQSSSPLRETNFETQLGGNLLADLGRSREEEALLKTSIPELHRCSKCILPETMPFIEFDSFGICNYCKNYVARNSPRPLEELVLALEDYRRAEGPECIIPFSGGRDSSFALHVASRVLGLRCVTYTYDWGMVTDLGRRNISRMCSQLGVENIVVAANIRQKRKNIQRNLNAWLGAPNLGLISLLTAGDKHFFKYTDQVRHQTGVSLNIWGINPLEVTHFKAGFLGVPPDFDERRVYASKARKQLDYQMRRFKAMTGSSRYFNTSL